MVSDSCLFTGDTLFHAGIGKLHEGSLTQMNKNLFEILSKISLNCLLFFGHDYGLRNLRCAFEWLRNGSIESVDRVRDPINHCYENAID